MSVIVFPQIVGLSDLMNVSGDSTRVRKRTMNPAVISAGTFTPL